LKDYYRGFERVLKYCQANYCLISIQIPVNGICDLSMIDKGKRENYEDLKNWLVKFEENKKPEVIRL
jgi:hypothetical protein